MQTEKGTENFTIIFDTYINGLAWYVLSPSSFFFFLIPRPAWDSFWISFTKYYGHQIFFPLLLHFSGSFHCCICMYHTSFAIKIIPF